MPLPDPSPALVQAPVWAGVGLRAELLHNRSRVPLPDWPEDWWQRNYDSFYEYDSPPAAPLTARMMEIPEAPT